jgi:ParB-like chromosome segregation protein Spo0J
MASSRDERVRLDRLAGRAGTGGGGLPLPLLFSAILNELLDNGSAADEMMVKISAATLEFKAQAVFATWPSWEKFTSDVLEQMASKQIISRREVDDQWVTGPQFTAGKHMTIIPKLGTRPADGVTVWEASERIARNKLARTDADLQAMYTGVQRDSAFPVTIAGQKKSRMFRLHPLARAIPPIPEDEFRSLARDIARHGVRLPLLVWGDQVLDGRHRLAVASALGVPVQVTEFTGSEDEARDQVVSLNVHRRHLTVAQRGLIVLELYYPQAEAEATRRVEEGNRRGGQAGNQDRISLAPDGAGLTPVEISAKATEIAAERSSGLASVRTLERMKPVADAPETKERIRSGEVKTAAEARRQAEKEQGKEPSGDPPAAQPRSAFNALGDCLGGARRYCAVMESGERGDVTIDMFRSRLAEIREYLDRGEKALESSITGDGDEQVSA